LRLTKGVRALSPKDALSILSELRLQGIASRAETVPRFFQFFLSCVWVGRWMSAEAKLLSFNSF